VTIPDWPSALRINAYTGEPVAPSAPAADADDWTLRKGPPRLRTFLRPAKPADPADWRDPRVGWGLVLPQGKDLADIEVLRALVADRGVNGAPAPVFQYMPGPARAGFLHRDGFDIPIAMAPRGTEPGAIPRYLLLYGTPEEIPWEVQYELNAVCAVGRLTLEGAALENYVGALRSGWKDGTAKPDAVVIWSVDHGPDDITNLMRLSIADPIFKKVTGDAQLAPNSQYLDGGIRGNATLEKLQIALSERRPGLIVTTSHGQTGPLDDVNVMRANLGLPVDEDFRLLQPASLLDAWTPSGAIWYAHACCSAGSDAHTLFDGLVEKDSPVDRVLKGVAAVGARVAPLPEALLGHAAPLRAFIGHVEPTFDWTLRHRLVGQFMTAPIEEALYDNLFQPEPLGLAFRVFYERLGGVYAEYDQELRRFNKGENNESRLLYHLLLARDIQSMVLLGDPTAVLPALP
jgi:hypothetical protein